MTLMNKVQEASTREAAGKYGRVLRSLINMDEPDHAAYRQVTQEWFSVTSVRKLQPMLQDLTNEFCDKLEADADRNGKIDFATEIATWYPLRVIMGILGVPREDLPLMHQLTKLLAAPQDPDFGGQAGITFALVVTVALTLLAPTNRAMERWTNGQGNDLDDDEGTGNNNARDG